MLFWRWKLLEKVGPTTAGSKVNHKELGDVRVAQDMKGVQKRSAGSNEGTGHPIIPTVLQKPPISPAVSSALAGPIFLNSSFPPILAATHHNPHPFFSTCPLPVQLGRYVRTSLQKSVSPRSVCQPVKTRCVWWETSADDVPVQTMSPCSRCTGRPRLRRRACLRANAWRTCGTVRSATISTSVRFCATTSADSSTILSHASLAAFASWLCSAVNCISTSSTRSLLVYWSVSLKSQVQALIAICNPRDHLSLKRVYDTKPSEIEKAFLWEFKGTLPNATPTMKQWLIRGLSRY